MISSPETELAKEFFSIANIITGFYVAQTLLFLNSLGKEIELRTFLSSDRGRATGRQVTWLIAGIYIAAVIACCIAEAVLRYSPLGSHTVLFIAIGTGVGRLGIILSLAGLCQYILGNVQPPRIAESERIVKN